MFRFLLVWMALPSVATSFGFSRRSVLANSAAAIAAGGWSSPTISNAEEGRFQCYQVIPDATATLSPNILAVQVRSRWSY